MRISTDSPRAASRIGRAAAILAVAALAGCGGSSTPRAQYVDMGSTIQEIGPNGGPAVKLNDSTLAEISQQFSPNGTSLRVTLLQPDLSSPATATASDVSARVFTPSGEQTASFSADSGSSHVWNSTSSGDFDADGLQGELTVILDGESTTRPFVFR